MKKINFIGFGLFFQILVLSGLCAGEAVFVAPEEILPLLKNDFQELALSRQTGDFYKLTADSTQKNLESMTKNASLHVLLSTSGIPGRPGRPYAIRGTLIAVSEKNPFRNLSAAELEKLRANEMEFWPDTHEKIRFLYAGPRQLNGNRKQAARIREIPSVEVILDLIRKDSLSIALLPVSAAVKPHKGVRFLAVDGISPSPENLLSGRYPLVQTIRLTISRPDVFESIITKINSETFRGTLPDAGIIPLRKTGKKND